MTIKDHNGLWPSDPRHPKYKTWMAMQARWRHNAFAESLVRKLQADAEALEISLKTRKHGT